MRKVFLLLLVAALNSNAMADWTKYQEFDSSVMYFNSPVDKSGGTVKVEVLQVMKAGQQLRGGTVWSNKLLNEFDCAGGRMRILSYGRYSGQAGDGNVLESRAEPQSWVSNANAQTLFKIACEN